MKRLLLLISCVLVITKIHAQLVITTTAPFNSPTHLIQNVLVSPQVPVLSVSYIGSPLALGYFNGVNSNIGLDSGIIITSGTPQIAIGPNNSGSAGMAHNLLGLPLLTALAGTTTNDAAQITFDFVALSDSIEFRYVFGSEEYPEYVNSINDVFGFFLTGYNPFGPAYLDFNIAIVPNSSPAQAISINNINCQNNSPYYICNQSGSTCPGYICGTGATIQYDGFTTVLTAKAAVGCGNVYTLKLAIADAGDYVFDSGVFFEAKSFKAPSINITSQVNSTNTFQDSLLVEGCAPSYLMFEKIGNKSIPMTINVVVSGTAVAGVDYAPFPTSITIPAGASVDSLKIEVYNDGITEANESIIITMQPVTTTCYVYPPQQNKLWIRDNTPMQSTVAIGINSNDTIFCPGDQVSLNATFSGGDGILTGWWLDDPLLASSRVVAPTQTTTYYFGVTDECKSDTVVDSVTIFLANYEPMTYDFNEVAICRGDTAFFAVTVSDGRPPYIITWPNAVLGSTYWQIPQLDSTYYTFTIQDQCGVILTDSALARLAPDPVAGFGFLNDYLVPLRVQFSNRSLNAASYLWDFGDGQTSTDPNPVLDYAKPGTYLVTLTITSAEGCTDKIAIEVTVQTDFYLYVPTAFTPDGDGLNECFEMKGVGFEEIEVQIFDRWGNRVFYGATIEECWDGTFRGELSPIGAYTYVIFLRLPFDKIAERRGVVTLYR